MSFCAADYTSLCEQPGGSGNIKNEVGAAEVGSSFLLLSTYVGSNRYMQRNMHHIISTSRTVSYPDSLLTLMGNPLWPEIKISVLPGQSVTDRPLYCSPCVLYLDT